MIACSATLMSCTDAVSALIREGKIFQVPTAIATGKKTWSGSINVSEDFSQTYETIAEKLKKQKDYKIGILSSVNLNHATPAAFYAHQESRNNYYDIGLELIDSNFDYFAGGALKQTTGKDKDKEDLYALAEKAGYKVICTCAKSHEGMDELKSIIENKTVAFAGLSGVGKSSIISILSETELETGNVSRIERGKHTTRHVELISSSGGYVFDTPGFSRLEADELRAENLWQYFPEIKEYHQTCRFRTCNHVGEPGCSVAEALSAGEIAQSRYNSYRMLYDKLKNIKEWERNDNNG